LQNGKVRGQRQNATHFDLAWQCQNMNAGQSFVPQEWNWKCWSKQKRTNGLAAFYQRSTWAIDNKI